jgi:phosphatidylinositol kinase/protein kinase (PI-3  family)
MVHAMGPTGTEGPFKIACEVALGLMRNQKDVLMSALRPFYFDPLLDWVPDGKHKKNDTGRFLFQISSQVIYYKVLVWKLEFSVQK